MKHAGNHAAFDALSEESEYWAGFLFADGALSFAPTRKPCLQLALSEIDKDHVYKLRSFLRSSHAVTICPPRELFNGSTSTKSHKLSVSSQRLVTALQRLGMNKHLQAIAIDELAKSRHFWRGVVDGDGSLGFHGKLPVVQLVGGRPLLEQYLTFVKTVAHTRASVNKSKMIFTVGLTGNPAIDAAIAMYSNCSVALDRKMEIATKIINGPRPKWARP